MFINGRKWTLSRLPPYKLWKNPSKKRYSENWLQDHEQGDLTLSLNEKVDVGCVSRKGNCIAIYGATSKHKSKKLSLWKYKVMEMLNYKEIG